MELYGKAQIILGDMTSHGGVVISGSPTNTWHGIPIVRKGDGVTCPRCAPHIFKVAEGLENCTDTAAALPMTIEGHRTTCGAVLIARNSPAHILAAHKNFYNGTGYDEQFILQDHDGKPIPEIPYKITIADGEIFRGITDESGRTDRIFTIATQRLTIEPDTDDFS